MSLSTDIREYALSLGYARVGFATADKFSTYEKEVRERQHMYDWMPSDTVGSVDPKDALSQAKSIVVTVYDYFKHSYPQQMAGKVGRFYQSIGGRGRLPVHFARHRLLKEFLESQGCRVGDGTVQTPARPSGARAGVTNYGKNCFAFADGIGSFISIGTLVIDKELEYDSPTLEVNCPEKCSACIDSCPTKALYEPLHMDPRRCIAYNTYATPGWEAGGGPEVLPVELRRHMGTWVFGCDVCQEVCPRNQARLKAKLLPNAFLEHIADDFRLEKLLYMSDDHFNRLTNVLMINYIKDKRYFRRNAAVALGNQGGEGVVAMLASAMQDQDALIRGHAAWALGRVGGQHAKRVLESSLNREASDYVIREIRGALTMSQPE